MELENNPYARRMAILETVYSSSGPLRSGELATRFNIESNLLAYDLQRLEELGLVERSFGWVRKRTLDIEALLPESEFVSRLSYEIEAKQALAEYIAEKLIPPGAQVAFDAGTTAYFVAKALVEKRKTVSIWTNNIPLFLYVVSRSEMPCYLFGGELARAQAALTGEWTATQASGSRFDFAILTPKKAVLFDPRRIRKISEFFVAGGVADDTVTKGLIAVVTLFNDDPKQLAYKRTIARNANRIIIPLTKGKLGMAGFPLLHLLLYDPAEFPFEAVRNRGFTSDRALETGFSRILLSRLLGSREDSVRRAVVEVLEELGGGPQVAELLLPLLQDPDPTVRQAVERALAKLSTRFEEAVHLRRADGVVAILDASPEELQELCPDASNSVAEGREKGFLVFLRHR